MVKDALDAVGAGYQQQLPVLGVGDELSDEDRADGCGIESVQAAEIKDHSIGARLQSIFKTG